MFMPRMDAFEAAIAQERDMSGLLNSLTLDDGDPDFVSLPMTRDEANQLFANLSKRQ